MITRGSSLIRRLGRCAKPRQQQIGGGAPVRFLHRLERGRRVGLVGDPVLPQGGGARHHRIDEAIVKKEVEAAGFKLVDEGNFLHNPADPRDAPVFKPKVPVDEFVLKYQKPQ